jgi:hypothetical protein
MRRLLLVAALIAVYPGTAFPQQRSGAGRTKPIVVAFFDEERLRNRDDGSALETFKFFLNPIEEVVKRDFPGVEFRVLARGELLRLPDGTGLNLQNLQPILGFVLSAQGKKRRVLSGVQTDHDFACAAAAFFQRSSQACSK